MNSESADFSHRTLNFHVLLHDPIMKSSSLQGNILFWGGGGIFLKCYFSVLYLVDLWEMQTWGSLGQKKGIMKMHKQLTVFASETESQELRGRE